MRDYPALHFDTQSSRRTAHLLLICTSHLYIYTYMTEDIFQDNNYLIYKFCKKI